MICGVGVDIGGRNIAVRADQETDLRGEAARHPLQLPKRELLRINGDAALRATEGDIDDGALPRHPHRQGFHLVEGDVLVIAQAALGGTTGDVVLDAIAGEDFD